MAMTLLVAALLSQPPMSDGFTARRMYDGCVRLIARGPSSSPATDPGSASQQAEEAICDASMAMEFALLAANDAMADTDPGRTQSFCPPDSILHADDQTLPLARAYVAWLDQHPAAQNETDITATLSRALAETWPCPH